MISDPCFSCRRRRESIRATEDAKARGLDPTTVLIIDPAPKWECKRHRGYGVEDETRAACREWVAERGDDGVA